MLDRLEELADRGWRLPLAGRIAISEERFLNIIDQMRISIPQAIKEAEEIKRERNKHVAQAHKEAREIIAQAREDAARYLDEHELRREAEAKAEAIVKQARHEAEQLETGADRYVEARLRDLQQQVSQLQVVIENGLRALENQKKQRKQGRYTRIEPQKEEIDPSSWGKEGSGNDN